jgi:hypothetical protein
MLTFPKAEFKDITGYGSAIAAPPPKEIAANPQSTSSTDTTPIPIRPVETSQSEAPQPEEHQDPLDSPVLKVADAVKSTSPAVVDSMQVEEPESSKELVEEEVETLKESAVEESEASKAMAEEESEILKAMVDDDPEGSHLLNVGPLRNYLNMTGNRVLRQILDTFSIEQKKLFKEVNSSRPEKSCISTSFRFKHQIIAPGTTPAMTYNLDSIMIKYGGMRYFSNNQILYSCLQSPISQRTIRWRISRKMQLRIAALLYSKMKANLRKGVVYIHVVHLEARAMKKRQKNGVRLVKGSITGDNRGDPMAPNLLDISIADHRTLSPHHHILHNITIHTISHSFNIISPQPTNTLVHNMAPNNMLHSQDQQSINNIGLLNNSALDHLKIISEEIGILLTLIVAEDHPILLHRLHIIMMNNHSVTHLLNLLHIHLLILQLNIMINITIHTIVQSIALLYKVCHMN